MELLSITEPLPSILTLKSVLLLTPKESNGYDTSATFGSDENYQNTRSSIWKKRRTIDSEQYQLKDQNWAKERKHVMNNEKKAAT